jgi:hypothetical protein
MDKDEFDYESLSQKDKPIKLSPRETDYLLFLLRGMRELKTHSDDSDVMANIINKLEWSRAKG